MPGVDQPAQGVQLLAQVVHLGSAPQGLRHQDQLAVCQGGLGAGIDPAHVVGIPHLQQGRGEGFIRCVTEA